MLLQIRYEKGVDSDLVEWNKGLDSSDRIEARMKSNLSFSGAITTPRGTVVDGMQKRRRPLPLNTLIGSHARTYRQMPDALTSPTEQKVE